MCYMCNMDCFLSAGDLSCFDAVMNELTNDKLLIMNLNMSKSKMIVVVCMHSLCANNNVQKLHRL